MTREHLFVRSERNPILTINDSPVPAEAVLNPGAAEKDGEVYLLIRVEESTGMSSIFTAHSRNGVDGWQVEKQPFLEHGLPEWRYERYGCEDPRITCISGHYYVTYTAYSPYGAAVGLAHSADLLHAERIGLIFSPNNKDAALFPEKFGDHFAVLHRPDAGGGVENIWIAFSQNLIHWGGPHCVLPEGHGAAWYAERVGAGPPPILTDKGWLLLYHGVKRYAGQSIYRVGAAILDRVHPEKVLARTPRCIFKPNAPYELAGLAPSVTFPTGLLLRGDELWMYYGAADFCIALAVAKLSDILNLMET